jgi:YVTN family beta-propeller protein
LAAALPTAPQALADGGAPNLAYVAGAGSGGDGLAIVDVNQRKVTATVPIGGAPASVVLSTDSRFAYVTESGADGIAVVDAQSQKVVATIPVGRGPQAIALDLSRQPTPLVVAVSGDDAVAFVDPDKRQVLAKIAVGRHPTGVAVALPGSGITETDPNDAEVYVANAQGDSVSVVSTQLRRVIATVPVPGGPVAIVVPASGGVAYVGTQSGSVVAVSLSAHVVLGTLLPTSGGPVGQMDYDAVTGQIYVPRPARGDVAVLRPTSDTAGVPDAKLPAEPVRTLPYPGGPAAVAITFDGALGFVTKRDAGRVEMLDVASRKSLATLDVGGTPRGVVTGSYPPALGRQQATFAGFGILIALVVALLAGFIWIERDSRRAAKRKREAAEHAQQGGGS